MAALALNRAHVYRLNTRARPVFTTNTKETAFGHPPFVDSFVLVVNTGHILMLRRKTCALLRAKTSALLRCKTCVES